MVADTATMENRRNYYRILHVQPDAPIALIKSSYRTLMQTLKMHPDLGGDHWNAQLINEAYAVLSEQEKREEYNAHLLNRLTPNRTTDSGVRSDQPSPGPVKVTMDFCLFCKTPYRVESVALLGGLCQECGSPLCRLPIETTTIDFRRRLQRIEKSEILNYYTYWPQLPKVGIVLNISPRGVGLLVKNRIVDEVGMMVKLESPSFSAVARIARQQNLQQPQFDCQVSVGMEFQCCHFEKRQGSFFSTRV